MKMKNYINKKVKAGYRPIFKKLQEVLENEGFNIVSEIKIHNRLKEEFQIDFRKCIILGTWHTDFQNNFPDSGTVDNYSKMQCNFVILQNSGNETEVGCYNPVALYGNSNNTNWKETEAQITHKLNKVIRQIESPEKQFAQN